MLYCRRAKLLLFPMVSVPDNFQSPGIMEDFYGFSRPGPSQIVVLDSVCQVREPAFSGV